MEVGFCYPAARHGVDRTRQQRLSRTMTYNFADCLLHSVIKSAAMMYMKRFLLFILAGYLLTARPAFGEDSASPASPTYLLRMERGTRAENVCILVRGDGQFHLERTAPNRSRIYEGSFPASSLQELQQMLDTGELQKLSQDQISVELVSEDLDQMLLAIRRPEHWQKLSFPTARTRKPFRNSLDPLVKWLDRVKQQPQEVGNATPSRCMPPAEATAGQTVQSSTKQSPANPYVMRMIVDYMSTQTLSRNGAPTPTAATAIDEKIERTCVVVYRTGRYRLEKSKQEFGGKMRGEVFRDSLSEAQLQDLERILDAPELKGLHHPTAQAGVTVREGETTDLFIPRGEETQRLMFATYFGARTQGLGMRDQTRINVDEEVQLLRPLRKWLKQNVEEKKVPPAKDVPPTNCTVATQPE